MSKIDPKFIVNLKGKEFVAYEGLLDLAHQEGLAGINTELLQVPSKENDFLAIVQAVAVTKDGNKYSGIGDCDNKSANSMISVHKIRMAETRAKARALRDLTNVGMTAVEEMGADEDPKEQNKINKADTNHQALKDNSLATDSQLSLMNKLMKDKNYSPESMISYTEKMYKKKSSQELTRQEASELINMLNGI